MNNSPKAKQAAQLQVMADKHSAQQQSIQKEENNTDLPDNLKAGIENLSGYSMDDVKVHRNSDKPAQLQAQAYVQGTDIHLGPGQEKHLSHEAWQVVQQKQKRVKPTMQMMGKINNNDDVGLEKEADVMGNRALQTCHSESITIGVPIQNRQQESAITQLKYFKVGINTSQTNLERSSHQKLSQENDNVIQRLVIFDEVSKTIIRIVVRRPTTGLQSKKRKGTNYHTAAIIIAQDMIATNILGLTYGEALEFFENITNDIVIMPGFLLASQDVQLMILNKIDEIHKFICFEADGANPMNWAAFLEQLSEMYIQTIDQLDYTYHEKGSGEVGSSGEGTHAEKLRKGSLGMLPTEEEILKSAIILLDYRKYKPKSAEDAGPMIAQYIQKMMVAYPVFAANEYLRTALITKIAKLIGLDPSKLFLAVDNKISVPQIMGFSSESSSDVAEIDPPSDWDGRSIPHEAFKLFITRRIRKFNIGGMRLTIIAYGDKDIRYRIGPRGG